MSDIFTIDTRTAKVAPPRTTTLLPDGNYPVVVSKVERDVQDTERARFKLTFTVAEGEFAKRKLFLDCYVKHPNSNATEAGRSYIKQLWLATGREDGLVASLEEVTGSFVVVRVYQTKAKVVNGKNIAPSNRIGAFLMPDGSHPTGQTVTNADIPHHSATATGKFPAKAATPAVPAKQPVLVSAAPAAPAVPRKFAFE